MPVTIIDVACAVVSQNHRVRRYAGAGKKHQLVLDTIRELKPFTLAILCRGELTSSAR